MSRLLVECIVVGLSLAIVAVPVTWMYELITKGKIDKFFPDHFVGMEISLFTTGVILHLIYEFTGLNMYYAKYKVKEI